MSISLFGSFNDLITSGILLAKADIIRYGAGEQDWFLTDYTNVSSEPNWI